MTNLTERLSSDAKPDKLEARMVVPNDPLYLIGSSSHEGWSPERGYWSYEKLPNGQRKSIKGNPPPENPNE